MICQVPQYNHQITFTFKIFIKFILFIFLLHHLNNCKLKMNAKVSHFENIVSH